MRVPEQVASQLELLFEPGIRGEHNAVTLGRERVDAMALARIGEAGKAGALGREGWVCGRERILDWARRTSPRGRNEL